METLKLFSLKVLYAVLFVVILPILLIIWAVNTVHIIGIPCPDMPILGYGLVIIGFFLVLAGMLYLWIYGHGLPMNAFPPKKFVMRGIYAYTRHPIYSGSILLSFGISIIVHSGSGFWLVSPLFTLLVIAYLTGFENERTKKVFGQMDYKPWLALPESTSQPTLISETIASYLLVFIPWLVVYEAFVLSGIPKDVVYTNLPAESHWPIWEYSELFYFFTYLFALAVPMIIITKHDLRNFILDVWFATIISGIIYLLLPFATHQRAFTPHSFFGNLILLERYLDAVTAAFPSFHVIWALIAARYFSRWFHRMQWFWYLLAILICISCITTGSHSVPDVFAGLCVYILVVFRIQLWNMIRMLCERLANRWKEWHFGPVRLINHGFYGGAAGAVGVFVISGFLGLQYSFAAFLLGLFIIIGSALWAQFIEGSPKLLRPYGFYGGVSAILVGCAVLVPIFNINYFLLLSSCVLAAPWIQLLGRLRCMVQGCCHGKISEDHLGIRFTHPMSRVNKIAGWAGKPLYPTQLYSIGSNLFIGLFLLRLVSLAMPATFIIGMCFILNGAARFVEESYRGEPQTPYWAGMRIYQWIAIISILLGALFTSIPCNIVPVFQFSTSSLTWAMIMFIVATASCGMDFPASNLRFARLTSN
jgi:protein-S-isoprenylcysteine O-methyltransferase Ste14